MAGVEAALRDVDAEPRHATWGGGEQVVTAVDRVGRVAGTSAPVGRGARVVYSPYLPDGGLARASMS